MGLYLGHGWVSVGLFRVALVPCWHYSTLILMVCFFAGPSNSKTGIGWPLTFSTWCNCKFQVIVTLSLAIMLLLSKMNHATCLWMWLLSTRLLGPTRDKIGMKRTQSVSGTKYKQATPWLGGNVAKFFTWTTYKPESCICSLLEGDQNEVAFKCDRWTWMQQQAT